LLSKYIFLLLLGYAKVYFHLPYRQTEEEGIAQEDIPKGKYLTFPITVQNKQKKINRLNVKINDNKKSKEFEDETILSLQ